MQIRTIINGEAKGVIPAAFRGLLEGAEAIYRVGIHWRNQRYEKGRTEIYHLDRPVISIGNITTGGTGKTPMVIWLCECLLEQGKRPAILCRGYKAGINGDNDEVQLLRTSLADVPIIVDANRVRGGQRAITEYDADVLVLDDGFQHRRLARDLDIVLIDATCPFGYGHLLPRGLLREPLMNLARADVVVLTRCDQVATKALERVKQDVIRLSGERKDSSLFIIESVHQPEMLYGSDNLEYPFEDLQGKDVIAICGIGNPESFRRTLEMLGARIANFMVFADHHYYSAEEAAAIGPAVKKHQVDFCVTTAKDWVKLKAFKEMQNASYMRRLEVRTHITAGREMLCTAIDARITAKTK
ncbi:MAG: tetraacyldisaccharide 4'-kinase [Sedimentisphaerales bacterium]|nr:tetraacyldisaccharide 4'-kinase [Sedimentisphaerales bacterium]